METKRVLLYPSEHHHHHKERILGSAGYTPDSYKFPADFCMWHITVCCVFLIRKDFCMYGELLWLKFSIPPLSALFVRDIQFNKFLILFLCVGWADSMPYIYTLCMSEGYEKDIFRDLLQFFFRRFCMALLFLEGFFICDRTKILSLFPEHLWKI